jgi:hypothetical protein
MVEIKGPYGPTKVVYVEKSQTKTARRTTKVWGSGFPGKKVIRLERSEPRGVWVAGPPGKKVVRTERSESRGVWGAGSPRKKVIGRPERSEPLGCGDWPPRREGRKDRAKRATGVSGLAGPQERRSKGPKRATGGLGG